MIRFLITGANGFIGTNLVEALRTGIHEPYTATLLDIDTPKIELLTHETWLPSDILDAAAIDAVFQQTRPDIVIHLAAQTSCEPEMTLDDYTVNTRGSENIFKASEKYGIQFLVHTSTQFVNQAEGMPASDTDYAPHTVYGESKVIAEQMLRDKRFGFNWCIIRPTNIWGRWHLRYPYEFWKILKEGKYFHPGKKKVVRSYGYVGNVCWQILELIKRRNEPIVSRNVFYVGDIPVNMLEWTNAFSLEIKQKPVRIVPTFFVYTLALTGSMLRILRVRFPITLSRYKSMTTDNPAPMEKTFSILGMPPYTQQQGVKQTTDWLWTFWQRENQKAK
jgi:nucleoside-diphosphate-sugar epimerase